MTGRPSSLRPISVLLPGTPDSIGQRIVLCENLAVDWKRGVVA